MSKKRKSKPLYKKMFAKIILFLVNRIDFVGIAEKIAKSDSGRHYTELFKKLPPAWENSDEISGLAIELTADQLRKEGKNVDDREIRRLVDEIKIRYNRDVHIKVASAIALIFGHVFKHQNPSLPFISPDTREIKHIGKLRKHMQRGSGVVFLINHSSHLDEFVLDLLWQYLGMGLPVFAAGQNMMAVESIAKLLMTGSYVVIRRGASRYQMAVLYNYCSALSRSGAQQGIFLEAWKGGARTRDGSLRYPKRLVTLKGAIDASDNLVVQPVAISYSVVPEDRMMCSGKGGMTWIRGMGFFRTLANFFFHPKTFFWRSLEDIYGRAYISLPCPMLLSELKQNYAGEKSGIDFDEFVALSSIKEIARTKKIMCVQVVARGLVSARKKELTDLIQSIEDEIKAIEEYHIKTFGHPPDFEDYIADNDVEDIIKDGLAILKKRGIISRFAKDSAGLPVVKDEKALNYYATHGDRRLYSPTADQNLVIAGAGRWGFALAVHIGNRFLEDKKYNNASITIYDSNGDMIRRMGKTRQGPDEFSDISLPKNVFVTSDSHSAFRKASEIIVAVRPDDFESHIHSILEVSEQPVKIIVAARGFVPDLHVLPYHLVQNIIAEFNRDDVEVYTLAGAVEPQDFIFSGKIIGTLAGPERNIEQLGDIFTASNITTIFSNDPIGVQTADILARIYAVCINYIACLEKADGVSSLAGLIAFASEEARKMGLALGASPDTFTAASVVWTSSLVYFSFEGPLHEFGKRAGKAAKKGKNFGSIFKKFSSQWSEDDKIPRNIIASINEALLCAEQRGLDLPLLRQAAEAFFPGQGHSSS